MKKKEVRKNRLFNRERSAVSVTSTSTTSSGTPTGNDRSMAAGAALQPGQSAASGTAAERSGKKCHGPMTAKDKLNEASVSVFCCRADAVVPRWTDGSICLSQQHGQQKKKIRFRLALSRSVHGRETK